MSCDPDIFYNELAQPFYTDCSDVTTAVAPVALSDGRKVDMFLNANYEKPEGTSKTNPDGGQWLSLKDISARLKKVFRGAYVEDEGCYIKIGNFLSRPEYKFESERKSSGMVYWVKER